MKISIHNMIWGFVALVVTAFAVGAETEIQAKEWHVTCAQQHNHQDTESYGLARWGGSMHHCGRRTDN